MSWTRGHVQCRWWGILLMLATAAYGRPDPSLLQGIPWELLDRDTVVPHAIRSAWVEELIALSRGSSLHERYRRAGIIPQACPPRLLVYKSQFVMVVEACRRPLKVYPISLSGTPIGTKLRLGDKRTPEGTYSVLKHVSPSYGLSLYVCYPNWADAFRAFLTDELTYVQFRHIELALRLGIAPPGNTSLGSQILIHTSRSRQDSCATCDNWSFGCIVMEPEDLDDLMAVIPWAVPIQLIIHSVDMALEQRSLDGALR